MAELQLFANNASTFLASAISAGGNTITFKVVGTDAELFPSPVPNESFFLVTVENIETREFEIFKVTERSGDTFTALRKREGTTDKAFPVGSKVQLRVTRGTLNELRNYTDRVAGTFTYENSTVSNNWVITHNLNRFPVVTIVEKYFDGLVERTRVVEGDLVYDDSNQITITFSEPIRGFAYLN